MSPPAWEAWIEMAKIVELNADLIKVASRMGGVD